MNMSTATLETTWRHCRRLAQRGQHAEAVLGLARVHAALLADDSAPRSLRNHVQSLLTASEAQLWPGVRRSDPLRAGDSITETSIHEGPTTALPKVSIIIPAFQAGTLLFDALNSLAGQRMHELETLVIDDASPDGGPLLSRLAAYPAWMRIRLLRLSANRGPAHCRNVGALFSRGRALCFLDADDTVDADAVASRWELLNADPSAAGAFVAMALVGAKLQPLGTRILDRTDTISFTDFASNKFPCSALMLRRSIFLLDLFDEALVYGEDFDCFARIAQRGGLYRRASKGQVNYRQHGASLTHKDTLRDLSQRMNITRRVHSRQLPWTLDGTGQPLAEATIVRESSLRAFPVGCVFALRGEMDKALQVLPSIAPEMVATLTPTQAANTLRFFLTREEQVPAQQVGAFLEQAQFHTLLRWLDTLFSTRHRHFVSGFVAQLTGMTLAEAVPLLPNVLGAPLQPLLWAALLGGEPSNWHGYLLFARPEEHMSAAAAMQTRQFLSQRGDLEGLLAYRVAEVDGQCLTHLPSICPQQPDAPELAQLGLNLWPALILHEQAARVLRQWLLEQTGPPAPAATPPDPTALEALALRGVYALRLKVVAGVPACFVQCAGPGARPSANLYAAQEAEVSV